MVTPSQRFAIGGVKKVVKLLAIEPSQMIVHSVQILLVLNDLARNLYDSFAQNTLSL
jgi:hypothetical protein